MNDKPRLLDLFCGAGGSAVGYSRAGFEVVGVDNRPQKHYPFAFVLADALEYVAEHGVEYDAIHASPPCQAYSWLRHLPRHGTYPDSIPPTLVALEAARKPFVLENVMGAKLQAGWLCGRMFGLPFERHRAFATNFLWLQPGHPAHRFGDSVLLRRRPSGRAFPVSKRDGASYWKRWADGVGIDWMNRAELTQAIPPAYTEFIGKQLLWALRAGWSLQP